ncbi:HlyD family type I secretion periplasmic adaptor subunit [Sphingomonas gilva]|uniref:Membrane fusion protein (MFP) family protein n=1 Tax=Sphingomonas gilva TaxID=2305907 RepID=A0A396S4K2_9SPHN|nr:HlyD family type I secretion periplasmic adaptor subunit [Sphingomonas gilva]RHW18355.1 HlyD family type I secretion periplasmic adaptor subunit [Sphingomonas gilva]
MKLDFLSLGGSGDGRPGLPAFDLFKSPRRGPRALDDASRIIRVALIVAGSFFGLFLLFALLAPISGAAVAQGEVTAGGTRIVIQPPVGGVVSELLVGEGEHVEAGQPLVRMNGVRSTAAAEQAQARRDALRALQARLIAERDGLDRVAFPPDLTRRSGDPAAASAMASQSAIFARRRETAGADRAIQSTERATAEAQRVAAGRQLALIRDELAGIRSLYRRGYARVTQVRALERAAAELEGQRATAAAAVARADLASARLADQQVLDIVTQLGKVDEQLAQADPALRVTRYDAERDTMRAPIAGRVSGVARVGPGSVIGAGETMMEVVPDGRAMIVEARVAPGDADDVRVGMPATLRFTTVNPRGDSTIEGRVAAFSPARVAEQNGPGYFRAQIIVDPNALAGSGLTLRPGLPVMVNIKTQSRTLFDYLFAPLEDAMSTGFREE